MCATNSMSPQEVVILTGVLKKPSFSCLVIPAGQAAAYIWIQTFSVCSSGKYSVPLSCAFTVLVEWH